MDHAAANPFSRRALALLIGAGLVLLVGFLLMSGFGNALTPANPIHPSANSRAAIGFAGLRQIVERTGLAGADNSAIGDWDHPGLLILTPRLDTSRAQIQEILDYRADEGFPTLVILPKWVVAPLDTNRNWAELQGLAPGGVLTRMLPSERRQTISHRRGGGRAAAYPGGQTFVIPETTQHAIVEGADNAKLTDAQGRALLFRLSPEHDAWVLADPDLLNNLGMKSPENARAAIDLLGELDLEQPADIAFDMTLPRGGAERNLVQLMFTPPFLGVTIAIFAAALLAGFASANRFGPALREARALAFGRSALIDNIAALTRAARRVTSGGAAYANAARERLARRLHAPVGLDDAGLVAWLNERRTSRRYAEIDHRLRHARTEGELLEAAQDLDDWEKEAIR